VKRILACLTALAATSGSSAHDYLSFDELMEAFNTDFDAIEIHSEPVGDGLYVLFGAGGNVLVSIGEQGTLMVDSQYAPMAGKIQAAVESLGGGGIDFTINTHWHFDHADGNPALARGGTWFVSHINSRRMMAGEREINLVSASYLQPAYPPEAMPVITYSDQMQFHFNDNTIDLLHFSPAHTTGDTAVFVRNQNVVHLGDVFNASYPFIDAGSGGDIDGMILFCESVLARLDADSTVIPGHGPVMGYDDLKLYIHMLETSRNRIRDMIDLGMSLEDVLAAEPTAEFDERFGDPARFIDRAYYSLSR
jgi:glyoxylase-like metal-dependent hydrolase (beta-lactamase superfamily II)